MFDFLKKKKASKQAPPEKEVLIALILEQPDEAYHKLSKSDQLNYLSGQYECAALHAAAIIGHTRLVTQLVHYGADINLPDLKGRTPLDHAVRKNHFETVKKLLDLGAQTILNNRGQTASSLHYAAQTSPPELLRLLCEHSSHVNPDYRGLTPLHWAIKAQKIDTVRTLLQQGADPEQLTTTGGNSLDLALAQNDNEAIITLLRQRGLQPVKN